jgi:hypothetical protein
VGVELTIGEGPDRRRRRGSSRRWRGGRASRTRADAPGDDGTDGDERRRRRRRAGGLAWPARGAAYPRRMPIRRCPCRCAAWATRARGPAFYWRIARPQRAGSCGPRRRRGGLRATLRRPASVELPGGRIKRGEDRGDGARGRRGAVDLEDWRALGSVESYGTASGRRSVCFEAHSPDRTTVDRKTGGGWFALDQLPVPLRSARVVLERLVTPPRSADGGRDAAHAARPPRNPRTRLTSRARSHCRGDASHRHRAFSSKGTTTDPPSSRGDGVQPRRRAAVRAGWAGGSPRRRGDPRRCQRRRRCRGRRADEAG